MDDQIEPSFASARTSGGIRLVTLAELARAGSWQLNLVHDRRETLLIWITRGQGLALLDGARRGFGTHNALLIPAQTLFSLDAGRQVFGQALVIPPGAAVHLPETVQHLRIRDVASQTELTMLLEALGREQTARRDFAQEAMAAYAALAAIWLRRHPAPETERPDASRRLSGAYCARLVGHFASGASMAEHAAALGVTPTHLTRVCRAETGRTAAALLTERLLHAARSRLIGSQTPVQEIARDLGFGSAAYFTRFVQQHTGQSPTALRRAALPHPPQVA
ncbi:MAG: helix-turn-helix transcriptional regulator [Sedimentitalea sp.]|nr:helix-turn-helix transcriptional regulator [Sedimentitalea sp.]